MSAAPKKRRKAPAGKDSTVGTTTESRPAPAPAVVPAAAVIPTAAVVPGAAAPEGGPVPPVTLAIDIGGTGIKTLLLDARGQASGERRRKDTPQPATPQAVLAVLRSLLPDTPYDRVSVGYPGVVIGGVTHSAHNLDPGFIGFDLQRALTELTGRPTQVLNDAGVQGFGAIEGRGTEAVVTLGTGMGFALYIDGRYAPNIELAHHPLTKHHTYEENVGNAARKRLGNKRWQKRVLRALEQIQATFNPRVLYIGGGNAERLTVELPENTRRVDNVAGLLGGIALWRST